MGILLITRVDSVLDLFFGIILIVFRKQIVRINYRYARIWMSRRKKQMGDEIEKLGGQYFYTVPEIGFLVIGVISIIVGLQELIFQDAEVYIDFVLSFLVLFVISAGLSGFCVSKIIEPILNRRLDRYMNDKYAAVWLQLHSSDSSLTDKYEASQAIERLNDPVYRKLRKRVNIYTFTWLIILTMAFVFTFYTSIKLTSQ